MSTRRTNRVRIAFSEEKEKLRQAISEPVFKWEKQWANPGSIDPETKANINYKVFKWHKTKTKVEFDPEIFNEPDSSFIDSRRSDSEVEIDEGILIENDNSPNTPQPDKPHSMSLKSDFNSNKKIITGKIPQKEPDQNKVIDKNVLPIENLSSNGKLNNDSGEIDIEDGDSSNSKQIVDSHTMSNVEHNIISENPNQSNNISENHETSSANVNHELNQTNEFEINKRNLELLEQKSDIKNHQFAIESHDALNSQLPPTNELVDSYSTSNELNPHISIESRNEILSINSKTCPKGDLMITEESRQISHTEQSIDNDFEENKKKFVDPTNQSLIHQNEFDISVQKAFSNELDYENSDTTLDNPVNSITKLIIDSPSDNSLKKDSFSGLYPIPQELHHVSDTPQPTISAPVTISPNSENPDTKTETHVKYPQSAIKTDEFLSKTNLNSSSRLELPTATDNLVTAIDDISVQRSSLHSQDLSLETRPLKIVDSSTKSLNSPIKLDSPKHDTHNTSGLEIENNQLTDNSKKVNSNNVFDTIVSNKISSNIQDSDFNQNPNKLLTEQLKPSDTILSNSNLYKHNIEASKNAILATHSAQVDNLIIPDNSENTLDLNNDLDTSSLLTPSNVQPFTKEPLNCENTQNLDEPIINSISSNDHQKPQTHDFSSHTIPDEMNKSILAQNSEASLDDKSLENMSELPKSSSSTAGLDLNTYHGTEEQITSVDKCNSLSTNLIVDDSGKNISDDYSNLGDNFLTKDVTLPENFIGSDFNSNIVLPINENNFTIAENSLPEPNASHDTDEPSTNIVPESENKLANDTAQNDILNQVNSNDSVNANVSDFSAATPISDTNHNDSNDNSFNTHSSHTKSQILDNKQTLPNVPTEISNLTPTSNHVDSSLEIIDASNSSSPNRINNKRSFPEDGPENNKSHKFL
ncbi:hypothetical protein AYI70_g4180 [Smittium culicis]|uniref:Uncharacterized protein n=1 Tax=Smittium culicis TaxID=133412 RepID=A0A1R1Y0H8_9FUNG|nr:hypothetical protein AYI70_g4180 [Smittium culicis]